MPFLIKSCFIFIIIFFYIFPVKANEDKNKKIIENLLSNDKYIVDKTLSYISKDKPPEILPGILSIILSDKDAQKKDIAVKVIAALIGSPTQAPKAVFPRMRD